MDYLELQQRANQIVSKVNNYEAGLAKYEITEADILAEHKYADLYTLRAVMNLLFGSTVDQKCDRSLNIPTDLRLFASTVPMWNTTFNLIPKQNKVTYTGYNKILTIKGTPTNNDGLISGLSNNTNAMYIESSDYPSTDFSEVVLVFTTPSNIDRRDLFIDDHTRLYLTHKNDGYFTAWDSVNSTDTRIAPVAASTTYYFRIVKNSISNTQYRIDYYQSTNQGASWSLVASVTQNKLDTKGRVGVFGGNNSTLGSQFQGIADLRKSYYKLDNDDTTYYFYGEFEELGLSHFVKKVGTPTIDDQGIISNFSTTNYLRILDNEYTGTLSTMGDPSVEIEFTITSEITEVVTPLFMHGLIEISIWSRSEGCVLWNYYSSSYIKISGPLELNKTYRLKAVVSDNNTKFSSYLYNFDTETYDVILDRVDYGPYSSRSYLTIGCRNTGSPDRAFSKGNINLVNSKINGQPLYYLASDREYDYEVKSDKHEFISDIDALNNYNLIHLDALESTVTSRDQRIKQGINYSYSSNIADALVTESQVVNMFKWNTTDPNTIPNNTLTLNRQVPGIVVYTIGPDYDKFYTSTIGYNPTISKFNAVNYGNPSTYGSYYRNDDVKYSQYSHETSTFASEFASCKIFMTGMNYTRGKLESPQQIWQPAEKYGDDNIGYGYNRQGQATYHELVFKNRRIGSGASNLDFTPAKSDIPDNDPQGLALRSVLAQQRDFYNGRPWFKELDVLYGANMSKFATNINQSSKIGSGTGSFDRGKFNIIGSPTLSDTGILSNINYTDYITVDLPPINTNSEVEITLPKFNITAEMAALDDGMSVFGFSSDKSVVDVSFGLDQIALNSYSIYYINGNTYQSVRTNKNFNVSRILISSNILKQEIDGEIFDIGSLDAGKLLPTTLYIGYCESGSTANTIDLSPLRIVVDGVEVFTAKATGETYMTDRDFYTNYKLSYDTYAESLNQPK